MKEFSEIPLTSATALDFAFGGTKTRATVQKLRQLTDAYQAAGLADLVQSPVYREALELTGEAVREAARKSPTSTSGMVANAIAELMHVNPVVREVATSMHRISVEVDRNVVEFRRYPGELVRFEGPEAIVVVDIGDREVLRSVNAEFLRSMGVEHSGDIFVQQQLQWSHDAVAAIYVPAIDLADDDEERRRLDAELTALEIPLPGRRAAA